MYWKIQLKKISWWGGLEPHFHTTHGLWFLFRCCAIFKCAFLHCAENALCSYRKKSWAHWPISYSCFLFHQNNDSLYVNTHISMNSHPDSGGHPGNNLSLDFQKTGATTLKPPAPLHTPLLVPNYCKCPFGLAKVSNNVDLSSTVSFGGDIRFELGWDFLLSWRVSFSLESDHPIPFFFYSYSSFEYCLRFLGLNA